MKKISVSTDDENWYEIPDQQEKPGSALKDQLCFWLTVGPRSFYEGGFDDGTIIELVSKQEILDWLDKYEE